MKGSARHLILAFFLSRAVICFDHLNFSSINYARLQVNLASNSLAANGYGRELRLRSTSQVSSHGILELFSEESQNFIPLCYPGLSLRAAHMICHHFGFTSSLPAHYMTNHLFINGLQFYIDCNGYEQFFDDCWIANRTLEQKICPYLVEIGCSACNHQVTSPAGMIFSPGFPSFYPQAVECEWIIHIPKHYELLLKIDTFDLPHFRVNYTCINGYLEIGFLINKGKHYLGRFCGQHILNPFISTRSVTWIRFYSGWAIGNHYPTGFNLTFEQRRRVYGNPTTTQILLAVGLVFFLMVMLIACICCYWKRMCRTRHRQRASRKENVVTLVEQYVNDTTK